MGVSSLLLTCGSQEANPSHQTWPQTHLPTEPTSLTLLLLEFDSSFYM